MKHEGQTTSMSVLVESVRWPRELNDRDFIIRNIYKDLY